MWSSVMSECVRCGEWDKSIVHAYFNCSVVRPLYKLTEYYILCMLGRKFFLSLRTVLSVAMLYHTRRTSINTWHHEHYDLDDVVEENSWG